MDHPVSTFPLGDAQAIHTDLVAGTISHHRALREAVSHATP
jgi:hypothetical protein